VERLTETASCRDADWVDGEVQMYLTDLWSQSAKQTRLCDKIKDSVRALIEQRAKKKLKGG
jgi:hypothetical protein